MEVLTTPAAMLDWSRSRRDDGGPIGVVPTMGALHPGHLALVDAVRERSTTTILTIFVNPLQFNVRADFDSYPRPIDDDLARCRAAGIDAVYAPTAAAMYPDGFQTHVEPGDLAERLEGAMRPGHFRGVVTVVTKLIAATHADVVAFGQKDFQQLAIIRRLVRDLDLDVEILGVPTVRDHDGLALSSRNVRLTPDDRTAAVVVPDALDLVRRSFRSGERRASALRSVATNHLAAEPAASLEYVEIVDASTLEPVDHVDAPTHVAVAIWFGDVRLIDNVLLEQQ